MMKNRNMSDGMALRLLGTALQWIAFLIGALFFPRLIKDLKLHSSDFGTWLEIALAAGSETLLLWEGHKCYTKGKRLSIPSADDLVARDPRPPSDLSALVPR
jgi:hypothetical protein